MDRGARQATVHGVTKQSDMTEQLNTNNFLCSVIGESASNYTARCIDTSVAKEGEIRTCVLMRWMKLEPIIQSEVSQKEKHQYRTLTR